MSKTKRQIPSENNTKVKRDSYKHKNAIPYKRKRNENWEEE